MELISEMVEPVSTSALKGLPLMKMGHKMSLDNWIALVTEVE